MTLNIKDITKVKKENISSSDKYPQWEIQYSPNKEGSKWFNLFKDPSEELCDLIIQLLNKPNTEFNSILVIYTGNWADEIDVSGLNITTKEEWELTKKAVKEYFSKEDSEGELLHYELIHDIGTNEGITYDSYESWLYDYEVLPIPNPEVATFIRTLIKSSFKNHFFYPEWDEDIN